MPPLRDPRPSDHGLTDVKACMNGCGGRMLLRSEPCSDPTFWVRPSKGRSGWRCNRFPPVPSYEREGRLTYVCPGCRSTYRLVDPIADVDVISSRAVPPNRRSG